MKKPKRRYESKEQILRKIDMFTKRKSEKESTLRGILTEIRALREDARKTDDKSDFSECIRTAQKLERRSDAIGERIVVLSRKLSALKEKLAEFQTETIPGFLPDKSVEAAK